MTGAALPAEIQSEIGQTIGGAVVRKARPSDVPNMHKGISHDVCRTKKTLKNAKPLRTKGERMCRELCGSVFVPHLCRYV
jgi:hypothetical protein